MDRVGDVMSEPMSSVGQGTARTRGTAPARLLDAAEELFARKGVDAVSLREIADAAAQRNNAAVHYHFGDKQRLIDALVADRMARIEVARQRALDRAGDLAMLGVEALLVLLWQPVLDLGRVASVHWFIQLRLSRHLAASGAPLLDDDYLTACPASRRIHEALASLHPFLPAGLFQYRMNLVAMMFWSAVSRHDAAARAANQTWSSRFALGEVVRMSAMALKAAPDGIIS